MRWLVASSDKARCLFFSNEDVRSNCAGQKIEEGKQNNFENRLFEKYESKTFNIDLAPAKIIEWLNTLKP